MPPRITVVGSINLDLVAQVERLPEPGETVGGAAFTRVPGGKGANQAVACARLGADVTMIAAVGEDPFAAEALAGLRDADVTLALQTSEEPTRRRGHPGRRHRRDDDRRRAGGERRPGRRGAAAARRGPRPARCPRRGSARGLGSSAPGRSASTPRPHVVSRSMPTSRSSTGTSSRRSPGATGSSRSTLGAEGAVLLDDGVEVVRAVPPPVEAVDGTAVQGGSPPACSSRCSRGAPRRKR